MVDLNKSTCNKMGKTSKIGQFLPWIDILAIYGQKRKIEGGGGGGISKNMSNTEGSIGTFLLSIYFLVSPHQCFSFCGTRKDNLP